MTGFVMMAAVIGLLWAAFAVVLCVIALIVDHLPHRFFDQIDAHFRGEEQR